MATTTKNRPTTRTPQKRRGPRTVARLAKKYRPEGLEPVNGVLVKSDTFKAPRMWPRHVKANGIMIFRMDDDTVWRYHMGAGGAEGWKSYTKGWWGVAMSSKWEDTVGKIPVGSWGIVPGLMTKAGTGQYDIINRDLADMMLRDLVDVGIAKP